MFRAAAATFVVAWYATFPRQVAGRPLQALAPVKATEITRSLRHCMSVAVASGSDRWRSGGMLPPKYAFGDFRS
ncbi:hypothetical protein BDW74DRAFT_156390 [Aspergillus multicolor]|uniref:uncharacterized protein n=1 Tax=Aspergillus multicolor TaxID=41759 RepID=UPI003CCE2B8C